MNINTLIRDLLRFILPKEIHNQLRRCRKFFLSYFHKDNIIFIYDGNVELKLPKNNYRSYVLQNDSQSHEILKRKIINFILKKKYILNQNIIDAGCHCGDSSLPWALNLKNKNSRIFCIDPSKHNLNYIKKTCKLNKINNISTFQNALSDKNNQKYQVQGDGDELFMIELKRFYKNQKVSSKIIQSKTLDFLSREFKFGRIGLLHIDAEYLDYNILKGSLNLIKKNKPFIVCEVFLKSSNMTKICKFLKKYNYKLVTINEKCGSQKSGRNLIAIPSKIRFKKFLQDIKIVLKDRKLERLKVNQSRDFLENIN